MKPQPRWVDTLIAGILRTGVISSVVVILTGMVVTFIHHPEYVSSHAALSSLTDPTHLFPHSLGSVLSEATANHGQALIMAGLLLLIATPVVRVAASILIFVIERDALYAGITCLVLALLLLSFVLGTAA